jgi:hypothetical protein
MKKPALASLASPKGKFGAQGTGLLIRPSRQRWGWRWLEPVQGRFMSQLVGVLAT